MTRRLLALALGATLPACTGLVVADRQPDDVPGAAPGGTATMPAGAAPATKGAVPDSCKGDEVPGPRRLRLLTRAAYAPTGPELALRAMLASPHFLYRSEVGEKAPDGTFKLTGYEVASALSYFLWGTTPDDQLLGAASSGALDQVGGVETQARRLLADPRSRPAVANFFREWLTTSGFQFTNKDVAVYPRFSDKVRNAMIAEEDAFVTAVTFADGGGTFKDLFTAGFVFANDALSTFYGLPTPVSTPDVQRVSVAGPDRNRGGLLTLVALLGTLAHPHASSPS